MAQWPEPQLYIEAPDNLWPEYGGLESVFLAGGITGCPDWQSEVADLIGDRLIVVNPRRANFPIDDPSAAPEQIEWEFRHLHTVDRILFWFPAATLCPIALYELGAQSMTETPIAVGIEPGYQREQDVRIQIELARPSTPIVSTLPDLVEAILDV